MGNASSSIPLLLLLLLLLLNLLLLWCGRCSALQQAAVSKAVVATGGELWCVAKNNAEDAALQSAIDWACGPGRADCRPIQQGGACFDPDDIQSHASYSFNDYYLRNGLSASACNFSGTAALTSLNPSHGSCVFPSSSSSTNGSFSGSASSTLGPAAYDMSGAPRLLLKTLSLWSTCSLVGMLLVSATTNSNFPSS
ncbi:PLASMODESMATA CALLOSE-BINDING PROTEIN 5-like [Zingiber officinale]|uniref:PLASMODESMATA CALLOSE-BINDING PROTEIN 5-like n=1 Tax=Zingiber officinale TaxID=94328 RepID=UPI001C4B9650|nr:PLASMODESMATA CALLOSE-BINDING PROTEIN 5-like [Zingiber officinale]